MTSSVRTRGATIHAQPFFRRKAAEKTAPRHRECPLGKDMSGSRFIVERKGVSISTRVAAPLA